MREEPQGKRQGELRQGDDKEEREGHEAGEVNASLDDEVTLPPANLLPAGNALQNAGADSHVRGQQFHAGPEMLQPVDQVPAQLPAVRDGFPRGAQGLPPRHFPILRLAGRRSGVGRISRRR